MTRPRATRSLPRLPALTGALAGALLSAVTLSAGPAHASPDPWSLLADLPPAVDAAAVLDRPGDRLWSDPTGRLCRAVLSGTGLFEQTERAWAGLARALGYTEDEAAAALLGGRVVVAWDGLTGHGREAASRADTRWAILAEVDRETARALRNRLRATPRRTVGGRVIYSIDAGRVAMALVERADQTRVFIAPNQAVGLLEAWLRNAGAPGPAATGGVALDAHRLLGPVEPGWVALAAVRPPDADGPAGLELRADHGAWTLRFAAPSDDARSPVGAPVGVLHEVGGDALLAAAFSRGPRLGPDALELGLRLGAPEPAGTERGSQLRTGRGVVVVVRAQERPDDARTVPVAQVITHAETDAGFAERADRLISALIAGDAPAAAPQHRGRFPQAVRTHALPDAPAASEAPHRPAPPHPSHAWPGPRATVAWCIAPDDPDRAGAVSVAVAPRGVDPAALARKGREAWARAGDRHDPGIITAGVAHPAALADLFPDRARGPAGALARAVDRAEWTVRLHDGAVRGSLHLRFNPAPARLGAP